MSIECEVVILSFKVLLYYINNGQGKMNTINKINTGSGNLFLDPSSRSSQLYQQAMRYMPGGNSRSTIFLSPHPFYVQHGHGCIVTDVEGVERIDFNNNFTSLIHGHADPDVIQAVNNQLQLGTAFGAPTESEIELAKLITERVSSIEQVRFTNSGGEAVLMAIRAARAFTGREKIAKFEGSYHGCYDHVEVSVSAAPEEMGPTTDPISVPDSEGIPSRVLQEVIVLPFNNQEVVASIIGRNHNTLAAVIIDPMSSRTGLIPPREEFFQFLRQITKRYGILLIADEVMMFRLAYGGGQEMFGMEPDLTTLGKIIGGGFPVGAVGGSSEIMRVFDPSSGRPRVPHGGTFNANPITMVAGKVTLEKFTPPEIKRLNDLGENLRIRLNQLFSQTKVKAQITGAGSLFRIHLTSNPLTDYRSSFWDPLKREMMSRLLFKLLESGVVILPNGLGCLSTPMNIEEVDCFVAAMEASLATLIKEYTQLRR